MSAVKRIALITAIAGLTVAAPAVARAEFGLEEFDVAFTGPPPPGVVFEDVDERGATVGQAGAHPFAMTTSLEFISEPTGKGGARAEEPVKDILLDQIAGFVGNPTAAPRCNSLDFLTEYKSSGTPDCPDATTVGHAAVILSAEEVLAPIYAAVYNLEPPPGVAAKLGLWISTVPITLELGAREEHPNNITGGLTNTSQLLEVLGSEFSLWGTPASAAHDPLRGHCLAAGSGKSNGVCSAAVTAKPFLTLPRACEGPLRTLYRVDSWRGSADAGFALTHDEAGNPAGFSGCAKLSFGPEAAVRPTTAQAESASGLEVAIDVTDEGIANPEGLASADIAATELRLPAGMTVSPSAAEGLGVCSQEQFEAASPSSGGCPESSKLGSLEVDTPILENHTLHGAFYQAAQQDNPFDSLLAAYLVIRDRELGVVISLAARIDTDPNTGQIVTRVEDMPPYPLERVRVRLRSGPRAPLVTPPQCGTYATEIELTPSSGAAPLETTSAFTIDSGPGGQPCPSGDLPFEPGFEAGSLNNAAAAYSPFAMRLTREDGEQDLTKFSATLAPGVSARLAGVEKCSDAALAAASSRSGRDEQLSPSCPAGSQIGDVVAGAGVGTALTYVDGALYLAGPYKGAPLSVAAIVPAVAGPFDVGTVVTRVGLKLNPVTGRGEVDGSASDPIPHILEGIPLKVREIRVLADRPGFTLNPTSCREAATDAQIFGGGESFLSDADDSPVARSSRYQAASCASLAFKPRLAIKLFGGVRRGAFPALRAVVRPPAGQANFRRAVVTLPRSAFLEQGHIGTICTRVQFAAGEGHGSQCPPRSVYGTAKAWSPLLDAPASGPVYLRSSSHNLPDLVVALKGPDSAPVEVELAARIDSVRGGIRSIFAGIPDLPVSRFVLAMQGGRKGLIVNSRNLCAKPKRNRVRASLMGQNGRRLTIKPVVRAVKCAKQKRRKAKRASASHRRAR